MNAAARQSAITLREHKAAKAKRGRPPATFLDGSDTFRTEATSAAHLHEILARGTAARAVGCTSLNERSSRSHAIITLNIEATPKGAVAPREEKLHLVDLAGSENLAGHLEAQMSAETRAINSSLTALCDVLSALSKNARRAPAAPRIPVPYRNHKLTRLLGDSLGGTSHTVMIAAVQTTAAHVRPTVSTLKFASRARDVVNHEAAAPGGGGGRRERRRGRGRCAPSWRS